jgi:hypothetical protein
MRDEFVVYKDHAGWFRWTTAHEWDDGYINDYNSPSPREEIGRFDTIWEARDVRHAYNMMVHGKPTPNNEYNRLLERQAKGELNITGHHKTTRNS